MKSKEITYAIEAIAYDPSIPGEITLRASTKGCILNGNYYPPRIKQPGNFKQMMFGNKTTGGASEMGYGEIVLINKDGGLDAWVDYGFSGRAITVIGVFPDGQATMITGAQEQPVFTWDTISLRIKDRLMDLNVPFQSLTYAGTNVPPNGTEGGDDIKGKVKPRMFGSVRGVTPVLVNASKLCYQLNTSALHDIPDVYDMAVSLTKGADYATSALLLAAAPTAGTYITCLAAGLFRLGGAPIGKVTADAIEGTTAVVRTVAQIVKRVVTGPFSVEDIIDKGFVDLDAANDAEVGIYVDSDRTISDVLDELCQSVGAWYGCDNLGKFNIRRLEVPTTGHISTLSAAKILKIERLASDDPGRGVPNWQVVVNFDKNYTPLSESEVAGSLTAQRKNDVKQPYKTAEAGDAAIQTAWLNSLPLTLDTLLILDADAQAEANRLLAMRGTRRDLLAVTCKPTELRYDDAGFWDDEAVTDMAYPRYDHTASVYDHYLYVVGGYLSGGGGITTSVIRLNLDNPTSAWSTDADNSVVHQLPIGILNHASAVHDHYLYVSGGYTAAGRTASVVRLDLNNPTSAWDDAGVSDLPQARAYHSMVVWRDLLIIGGGTSPDGTTSEISSKVMFLDLTNPTCAWNDADITDFPSGRESHRMCVYNDYLITVGGLGLVAGCDKVMRLNMLAPTGSWDDVLPDLPVSYWHSMGLTLNGDRLCVVGGVQNPTMGASVTKVATTIVMNLAAASPQWDDININDLPAVRYQNALVSYRGNMLTIGGGDNSMIYQPNSYLYRSNERAADRSHIWDRGRVIKLDIDRFGYNTNKLMRIVGSEIDLETNRLTLQLWG